MIPKGYEKRDYQIKIIQEIYDAFKEHSTVIFESPTGTGKSVIAKAVCDMFESSYIATSNKVLQDQYVKMFNDVVCLKGRHNYKCDIDSTKMADNAKCSITNVNCMNECTYLKTKALAEGGGCAIVNHNIILQTSKIARKDIIVFDEAHKLANTIRDLYTITIDKTFLDYIIETERIVWNYTKNDYIKECLIEIIYIVRGILNDLNNVKKIKEKIEYIIDLIDSTSKEMLIICEAYQENVRMRTMLTILHHFVVKFRSIEGQIAITDNGVVRYPTNIKGLLEFLSNTTITLNVIGDTVDIPINLLLMSATIGDTDKFKDIHGIKDAVVIRKKSTFSVSNRPFICLNLGKVTHTGIYNKPIKLKKYLLNIRKLCIALYNLLGNGVIHTTNYRLTNSMIKVMRNCNIKLHYHKDSNGIADTVESYIKEGGIIISPSIRQGVDFKDDIARWQVIIKVPYEYYDSNINNENMFYNAAIEISQAYGRIIRSDKDYGITICTDSSIRNVTHYITPYLKEATNEIEATNTYV